MFQGVNVHSEDLLRNPLYIKRAISKGLVIFSWGDDANDPDNRKKLKEYGVHGLIYDRYHIVLKKKIIIIMKLVKLWYTESWEASHSFVIV